MNGNDLEPFIVFSDVANIGLRWTRWLRKFELFMEEKDIVAPNRLRAALLRRAGDEVQDIAQSLEDQQVQAIAQNVGEQQNPQDRVPEVNAYQRLVALLNQHFLPQRNEHYERQVLKAMQPKTGESSDSFILRLREQAKLCAFDNRINEEIRDAYIDKCPHTELKSKLLNKLLSQGGNLTIQVVAEKARLYERVKTQMDFQEETPSVNKVRKEKSHQRAKKKTEHRDFNCYACGRTGHFRKSKDCPAKGKKCSKCGFVGHFAKCCKSKKHCANQINQEEPSQPTSQDHQDGEPIMSEGNLSSYEKNLYLYHEEMPERPRVATLLNSLANYNVAIPSISEDKSSAPKKANLGTVAGVYLPCIQNILGVIFFIRMGWIVGTAGVPLAFLVVFLSCCVTFTTCISLSAIATNGIVPAGGSYFMISRSLGPEFGGAVGILFYLATSIAAAMYIIGAVEIFLNYMAPSLSLYGDFRSDPAIMYNNFRTYGTVLLVIVGTIVFIGVKFVSKFAPIALFCVIISLVSVYVGVFTNFHGKEGLDICVLGDRLLSKGNYTCSKDQNDTSSLFYIYCSEVNKTDTGESLYSCDPYFESKEVASKLGIPGMAGHMFHTNVPSRFRQQGDYISEAVNREEANSYGQKTYNQILIDLTTSFTVLLAIFFSSCTGILAGSNRSGDLADAQKSIPAGTLAAQLTTSVIYLTGVILFGATFNNLFMRDKFGDSVGGGLAVADLAWPHPWVVIIGSFLSTIGAGLQSLTGAPRLLQAIAKDQIIPFLNIFSYSSSRNEPSRALFLTIIICEIGILIGNLDHIAPILTMFFLMCYMFVNLACVLQSLLHTPNWRPRFKYYHWSLSMAGSILCLVVMFLSSWYYALFAIAIAGCMYKYIEYSGAEKEWGDGIRGLALSAARYSLLRLEEGPPHTKNWRPQVLILCKLDDELNPKYPRMFSFASQLKAGKGLTIVCSLLEGSFEKMYSESQAAKLSLKRVMDEEKVKGFADVLIAKDLTEGICHLIQTAGLGGLKHNTVILGWPYGWRQSAEEKQWRVFLNTIRSVSASKNALLVPKGINVFPSNNEKVSGNIDVWWIVHDGGLLMLLPFLLKQHKTWKNCKLRIFTVAQLEDNSIQMKKDLARFLYHLRIEADVEVVEMMDSDISAYTYERTLLMEQRNEILKQLKLSCGGTTFREVQNIVDHHHHQANSKTESRVRFNEVTEEINDVELIDVTGEEDCNSQDEQGDGDTNNESFDKLLSIRPDEANVRRMHTAVKLNEVIVAKSHNAQLVILNLPGLPKASAIKANYMEFLEVLTEGLERVLMVRGGGREVITIYS